MTDIISNATPFIAFARIGQLPLMQKVVGQLVIPEAVAEEITAYHGTSTAQMNLSQESWIGVESLQSEE